MSQFRFILIVFYFTAVLIFAVYLRGTNNRVFYKRLQYEAHLGQLDQELVAKELLLENLINPAAITKRLNKLQTSNEE